MKINYRQNVFISLLNNEKSKKRSKCSHFKI